MSINDIIIDTLKPLNIPVSFQVYKGKETVYVVFMEYLQQGEEFSEDEEESTAHYIQISLYSKKLEDKLIKEIKSLMKNAGFKRLAEYNNYESEIGYNNHIFRFFYLEEIESEE